MKPHPHTKQNPILAWERGIFGTEKRAGRGVPRTPSDPRKFFLDFLERKTRTIQKYGIVWDYMNYRGDVFRKYIDNDDKREFHVCRNPYDVSVIYWKDPDSGDWLEIQAADIAMPSLTLAELNAANRLIRERGDTPDNDSIKASILARREISKNAATETRRVRSRRDAERHRKAKDLRDEFSPRERDFSPSQAAHEKFPPSALPDDYRTDIVFEVE